MHPVIATFLDVRTAVETLERGQAGATSSPTEAAYLAAARAHSELASLVLRSKGKNRPSEDAQNATILLAVHAAMSLLPADQVLGDSARKARSALAQAGAETEQIDQLIGGVLVEEAFSGDHDPQHFDAEFVLESFSELPRLAQLDSDTVSELLESFAKSSKAEIRPISLKVAETLFQAAWGEGPQGINVEHVDETLEGLAPTSAELQAVKTALEVLLRFLSAHQWVGPLRLERLLKQVQAWSLAGDEPDSDEEDSSDDDDDDGRPLN